MPVCVKILTHNDYDFISVEVTKRSAPCLKHDTGISLHEHVSQDSLGNVPVRSETRHEFRYMTMLVLMLGIADHRLTSVELLQRTGRVQQKRVDSTSTRSP